MRDRESERKEEEQYRGDVIYEVWRSGDDPDRISDERVDRHRWDGDDAGTAARHELRIQRERREARQLEEQQEQERIQQNERDLWAGAEDEQP